VIYDGYVALLGDLYTGIPLNSAASSRTAPTCNLD